MWHATSGATKDPFHENGQACFWTFPARTFTTVLNVLANPEKPVINQTTDVTDAGLEKMGRQTPEGERLTMGAR